MSGDARLLSEVQADAARIQQAVQARHESDALAAWEVWAAAVNNLLDALNAADAALAM